jgi:hypothetical protein
MKLDYPGIGGSLGECVVCGECFALEILMGRSIATVEIPGFERSLPLHPRCLEEMESIRGQGWESLPEGPLRQAYAEHFREPEPAGSRDRDEWKHEAAEQQRLK